MGKADQTVGRWEKASAKSIDPIADRFVRIIYCAKVAGNAEITELLAKLAAADQAEATECRLEEADGRWRVAAAA
jgi:hypothetical protein